MCIARFVSEGSLTYYVLCVCGSVGDDAVVAACWNRTMILMLLGIKYSSLIIIIVV